MVESDQVHSTPLLSLTFINTSWNAGEDLAFLIAPDLSIPEASYGQWLGLTNAANDGKPTN
ncbi:hypothetical protein CFP56_037506 [Quercus suber]|uniref:Legume lectin domain-containing protein n=1 Tax=Quercus suber TaxID=58331 RepID=A0AAW0J5A8_QUESU